ncbi:MAG: nitroreductase family protein [Proteobacteria bacterium]|nr:nitroreductase family protein [Pseudomonadota bacterium]
MGSKNIMQEQVIIDKQKCTGCGLCVTICPYRVISATGEVVEHSGVACFLCDHCRAVCPQGAITTLGQSSLLGLTTMEEKTEVVRPGTSNGPELVALMRSRRSCRQYQEKAVPLAMLLDLVKIGTTAPSGTNSQGWNFVILPSRRDILTLGDRVSDYYRKLNRMAANALLRGLVKIFGGDSLGRYYRNYFDSVSEALRQWEEEGTDRLFHGAVAAILVTGKKTASCPAEDALLATQNILLAAHAMGLGSCLIGFAVEAMRRNRAMRQKMEVPEDEEIYSVIALGFPAIAYLRHAGRKVIEPRIVRSIVSKQ